MILLTLMNWFLIASLTGATLVGSGILFFYIKNSRFRKNCDADWPVKVYHGEEKCFGTIRRRIGDQVYVEYLSPQNEILHRYFHINNIYPAW